MSLWPNFTKVKHPHYKKIENIFVRGDGAYLFDKNNRRIFDGFSTLWTNLVGHGRIEIIDAITDQLKNLSFMHLFTGSLHEPGIKLSKKLVEMSPLGHKNVFFGLSGSDATETAIKMARLYWRRKGKNKKSIIVGRSSEYHGTSLGALSLMGTESYRTDFGPLLGDIKILPAPNCYHCPWNLEPSTCKTPCKDVFETYFKEVNALERVAAILIEPAITSDGLILSPPGYWDRVQKICKEHNVLIIADEVSTGMGRSGELYGSTVYNLKPDITYLAKSLTSGYAPLSAVLASEEVFETINDSANNYFPHGSTFAGHPASCIAAFKVLEILERENLISSSKKLAEHLNVQFKVHLSENPFVGSVRGFGTLFEIELVAFSDETTLGFTLYNNLLNRGQYIRCLGKFMCIAPPLVSKKEDITEMVFQVNEAIKEVCPKFL